MKNWESVWLAAVAMIFFGWFWGGVIIHIIRRLRGEKP